MGWAEGGLGQGKELQVLVGSGDSGKWGRLGRVQPVRLAIPVGDKNSGPEVRGCKSLLQRAESCGACSTQITMPGLWVYGRAREHPMLGP